MQENHNNQDSEQANRIASQILAYKKSGSELNEEVFGSILLKLHEIRFDEFKNHEMTKFRRVRQCIEHENILVNHRMTWLITTHIALFALLSALIIRFLSGDASASINAREHFAIFIFVISILGMFICFNVFRSLSNAVTQLHSLTKWYREKTSNDGEDSHLVPPIHYWARFDKKDGKQRLWARIEILFFETRHVPLYFVFIWFLAGMYAASYSLIPFMLSDVVSLLRDLLLYFVFLNFIATVVLMALLIGSRVKKDGQDTRAD
jgi:hypothetical protein